MSRGKSFFVTVVLLIPGLSLADTLDAEIDYLISAVGRDGCSFIRNDRRWPGREARAHLRSKWELNAQLIASTEDFIEKVASRSAVTGESYLIRCRGQEPLTADQWFRGLLAGRRKEGVAITE